MKYKVFGTVLGVVTLLGLSGNAGLAASYPGVSLDDMVRIQAGPFTMVKEIGDKKENQQIYLNEFYMDKFEVSIPEYARCVSQGKCNADPLTKTIMSVYYDFWFSIYRDVWYRYERPPIHNDFYALALAKSLEAKGPIGYVQKTDAVAYCAFVGKRLPTNAEWEKAARGDTDDRTYSWGNETPTDCTHANLAGMFIPSRKSCPKGPVDARDTRYPPSPYGIYNMIGNQTEYVSDTYGPSFFYFTPVARTSSRLWLSDGRIDPKYVWGDLVKGMGFMARNNKKFMDGPLALPSYTPAGIGDIAIRLRYHGQLLDSGMRCVASKTRMVQ